MFKSKPMPSYLSTKTLMLAVILVLFNGITAQECLPVENFDEEVQPRLNQLLEVFDAQEKLSEDTSAAALLFREDLRRSYSIDPDNFAKMVKFQILLPKDSDSGRLEELTDSEEMGKVDREAYSNDGTRVAPETTEAYCIARNNDSLGDYNVLILVSDRFRGTLNQIAYGRPADKRFVQNMALMSSRFEFYTNILNAYKFILEKGWKHCNLRPQSIFYVEKRADWESDYQAGEERLDYVPVIGDYTSRVGLSQPCIRDHVRWIDKKDVEEAYLRR